MISASASASSADVDREAGGSRGGVERLPDACPLRCEQFLQHHALGRGLDRRERGVTVLGVERGVEHGAPVRIDEHRGERVRRLVASGAGDRPHRVERFVGGQDLLDVHRVVRHLRRDAFEVRSRVRESVDVVDAQPVHDTVVQELEGERVRRREHVRILDAHADQVRHVEEAPVVEEPTPAPPLRELVRAGGPARSRDRPAP